jgi:hypothetical protein
MKVNSYALFGDIERYGRAYLPCNIRQHVTLYNNWTFWIHIDKELTNEPYNRVLKKLSQEGFIRISYVQDFGNLCDSRQKCMMMLWRLLPLWQDTEYVFCRDLDSILTPRQLQCTRSFINSGRIAHGINDNICHNIPLMGGMCGFKTNEFVKIFGNSLNALVSQFKGADWNQHGTDQIFLMNYIYPLVAHSSLVHSLDGPNRRSHLKIVTDADISDIEQSVRDRGDDFANYIGANGFSCEEKEIVDFYNTNGNQLLCKAITQIEREEGIII